jgi:hypothetical protein
VPTLPPGDDGRDSEEVYRIDLSINSVKASENLCGDHLFEHLRLVIDDEMGVTLHHRECLVPEHIGDFQQRGLVQPASSSSLRMRERGLETPAAVREVTFERQGVEYAPVSG